MIKLCAANDCTGCMTCINICPQNALTIEIDKEGFEHPIIIETKCINCGLCEKTCPILNPTKQSDFDKQIFACWSKNKSTRRKSSSGGLFSELAEVVFAQGGVIFGAAFDDKFVVHHTYVEDRNNLYKLQGSKYVQSSIRHSFKDVRFFLDQDRLVLFSGTPCQVAGLKKYLTKDYPNLLTLDLICHGVPSPMLFEDYKLYIQKKINNPIKDFKFRDKRYSWIFFNITVNQNDKKQYIGSYYSDPYLRGFLNDYFLRPSCYNCQFANLQRIGDITIADFWGYRKNKNETVDKNFNELGVSLAIINTSKGKDLFEKCKSQLFLQQKDIQDALKSNKSLSSAFSAPERREAFWADYFNLPYTEMIKKWMGKEKKPLWIYLSSNYKHSAIIKLLISLVLLFCQIENKTLKILKKIKFKFVNKYFDIINRAYYLLETKNLYNKIARNKSLKTIYLFSNPTHSNLGDQAQTFCILKWMQENYPSYKIICAPKKITPAKTLQLMHDRIKSEDLLFIHSGYLLFDPHPELPYICEIINLFKDKRIVILPQTINLISQDIMKKVQETFNKYSNLTILCRDNVSYTNAQKIFSNCKLILWPDFVTSLIGTKSYITKRNGILFCLRNDNEKYYSDEDLNNLKLKLNGIVIDRYDTSILKSAYAWKYSRKKLIQSVLDKFSKYQLVITDRYHGTIFSQIASTPVIVLASTDHKLKSGVEWFPKECFKENVFFAESLGQAYQIANEILNRKGNIIENPSFFKDEYFSKLRTILDSQH